MFKNYFKIAWRNVVKNSLHSAINIIGLAVGLASFIVILVYLNYELSYDKWDASLQKVYKVSLQQDQNILKATPAPLASLLLQNYPNAQVATTIQPDGDFEILLSAGEKKIYQKGIVTVEDSSFFSVFPYKLVQGDRATALNAPNAVILSEEVSSKLFPNSNPIGKPVKIYNSIEGVVTGVMKTAGLPSHLDVKMLMRDPYEKQNKFWGNYSYQTYIKLKQPLGDAKLDEGINDIYYNARLKKDNKTLAQYRKAGHQTALFTDQVQNLHNFPKHGESRFKITLILLVLAVFLLVAGAINFSNLAVARAVTRAKEVGIRKVLGSNRAHIIIQSLLEITIQCVVSLTLAVLLANIALPYFSQNFNLHLSLFNSGNGMSIYVQLAGTLLVIIIVSGLYPALFLSHFQTADVLKGKFASTGKSTFFRNSLLVVQLTLSALFITAIIVVNRQISFMQNKDLGFNASQVMRIEATQDSRDEKFALVQNTLLTVPGVEVVSKSTSVPASRYIDTATDEFKYAGNQYRLNSVKVSADYFKTMGIKLLNGRFFDSSHAEDADNTAIINESAWKKMGAANVVGQLIRFPYCDSIPYTIVGVVRDFNVQGMENQVVPSVYSISNAHCGFRSGGAILLKINTDHSQQTIAGVQAAWKKIEPDFPLRYSFLDQDFQKLYAEYTRLRQVVFFFSVISILIAATGLFALTSFLAQLRIKEIGVRKVLGASIADITALLSKDFIRMVVLAIVVALPIAWWALSKWLDDFAYRISLTWWMFAAAGFAIVSITLITVCCQAIRAAVVNPVKSLRTE